MHIQIRTGGQTGVDRAALQVAVERHLPYGGWCPRGGWAADRPIPPGILADYPQLTETPSAAPEQRTAWNVRDSHLTLILYRGNTKDAKELADQSLGTWFTWRCAVEVFLRPCLILNPDHALAAESAAGWIQRVARGLAVEEVILNVAGPRKTEDEHLAQIAPQFLHNVLGAVLKPSPTMEKAYGNASVSS
jgi:hypothetical protein